MDPALQEMLDGDPEQEVEALIRLREASVLPSDVRLIAAFGNLASIRLPRGKIRQVWSSPAVLSLKAPRYVAPFPEDVPGQVEHAAAAAPFWEGVAQPGATGKGVVIGVIDWGFDFTHPVFREDKGASRFLALWDQGGTYDGLNKYSYGRVLTRETLNQAMKTAEPFEQAGYHPDPEDHFVDGTHGTHVGGIAAQIAPEAELIGVHLATGKLRGRYSLGDSVRLVEAIDFILKQAQGRPCSMNMSVGSSAGSFHAGRSLVEQAIDACLMVYPGVALCQSAGNYYTSRTHSSGRLEQGARQRLPWVVDRADVTPNELEVWYPGEDAFEVRLMPPSGESGFLVKVGEHRQVTEDEEVIGNIYHRQREPNTGQNHVDIFLYPNAPDGLWQVELSGAVVNDGRYHAWIERDGGCRYCQSRFAEVAVDNRFTTGTIANSHFGIAVGAYDAHREDKPLGSFSSRGPTTDGRQKPELIAPGVAVLSARSASRHESHATGELTRMSGTSMAAPHVTGALALLFEAVRRPLSIKETRRLLLSSTIPYEHQAEPKERFGYGLLDIERLITMGKTMAQPDQKPVETSLEAVPLLQQPALFASEAGAMADMPVDLSPESKDIERVLPSESGKAEGQWQAVLQALFRDRQWPDTISHVELLAGPGQALTEPVRAGDLLIRGGRRDELFQSRIIAPLREGGERFSDEVAYESSLPGIYALVAETTSEFQPVARRLTNAEGYLPLRQAVLRPRTPLQPNESIMGLMETLPSSLLRWPGASETQLVFMQRVYEINLRRSASRGTFVADVPEDELAPVEGRFQLRMAAARDCGRLLQDARMAIAQEGVNVRIGLASAYRSASRQLQLWQALFPRYYQETRLARQEFGGGEHSDQAAQFLAQYIRQRIATPGFSTHNNALAVDFRNEEATRLIRNHTRPVNIQRWHSSWLWGWLTQHAAQYGFFQNTAINEPWHWEYRGRPQAGGNERRETERYREATLSRQITLRSFRKLIYSFQLGKLYARFEGTGSFSVQSNKTKSEIELILSQNAELHINDLIFGANGAFSFSRDKLGFSLGSENFSISFDLASVNPIAIEVPIQGYTIKIERDLPALNLKGTASLDMVFVIDFIPNYMYLRRFVTAKNLRNLLSTARSTWVKLAGKSKTIGKLTVRLGRSALIAPIKMIGNSIGRKLALRSLKLGSQTAALGKLVRTGGRLLGAVGIIIDTRLAAQASLPGALTKRTRDVQQAMHLQYANSYAAFLAAMTDTKAPMNDRFFTFGLKVKRIVSPPPDLYAVVEHASQTGNIRPPNKDVQKWKREQFQNGAKFKDVKVSMSGIQWQELYREAFNLYWLFIDVAQNSSNASRKREAWRIIRHAGALVKDAGMIAAYQDIFTFILSTSLYVENNTNRSPQNMWDEWKKVAAFHRDVYDADFNKRVSHYVSLIDLQTLKTLIPPFVD